MRDGGGESERLAPVIPLFGGGGAPAAAGSAHASQRHPANGRAAGPAPTLKALRPDALNHEAPADRGAPAEHDAPEKTPDATRIREAAEEVLVRRLRTRSLSIAEARTVLKGYALQDQRLDAAQVDDVIDDFCRRGYLDDAVLAGHLVTSGVERKGQGRVALSRALAQRGIPRDVIGAALDELPDDDADRALSFARTKAGSLVRLDGDTALRRLVGQLARRGYNGAVAMTAAKTALAEAGSGRPSLGVRFVDSD
ncbi:regulatory protein RecX [Microbacterium sp. SD291]|uniref:regulatory protein RecX n=1 Tax=Microbacterium sp. SD291 TaxID=2782007 RepID=UPI001A959F44|nr:regulatory protein RecX [Microbacterium sp. SD291]MBO0979527.1 regulatory protein RecX [Microbacterium sp. SD291]